MEKFNKNIRLFVRLFFLSGAVGAVVTLFVLFRLSTQEAAWLLGRTRFEWILSGILLAGLAGFLGLFVWLKQRGQRFFGWLENRQYAFFAGITTLLQGGLVGLFLFEAAYLRPSNPDLIFFQQTIQPVFWFVVVMFVFGGVLCLLLNWQINHQHWIETLLVRPMVGDFLEKFSSWMNRMVVRIGNKIPKGVWIVLVLAWPLVFNQLISRLVYGTTLTDIVIRNPDEAYYWLEAAAFITAGFNGGQFGADHGVAKADFIHFGPHGPFFAIFQGGLGKLIGWQSYTPVVFNLILTAVVLIVTLVLLKPDKPRLAAFWLLLASFAPLYKYLASFMQQAMHIYFGLVIGVLFVRWIKDDGKSRAGWWGWLLGVIFLASLFRYSWLLLALPLAVVGLLKLERKQLVVLLGGIALSAVLSTLVANWLWAPYPRDIRFQISDAFDVNFWLGVELIWTNIISNMTRFFNYITSVVLSVRLQMTALVFFSLVFLGGMIVKRRKLKMLTMDEQLLLVSSLNILSILVLNISMYYVRQMNDLRIWAPHVFLSLVLLLYTKTRREFWAVWVLGFVALFPLSGFTDDVTYANPAESIAKVVMMEEFEADISDYLAFEPGANKWCNTVTVSKYSLGDQNIGSELIGLPAGFGFMVIVDWDLMHPSQLESKYLLVDPVFLEAEMPGLFDKFDLEYLTTTSLGNLYLNQQSTCAP